MAARPTGMSVTLGLDGAIKCSGSDVPNAVSSTTTPLDRVCLTLKTCDDDELDDRDMLAESGVSGTVSAALAGTTRGVFAALVGL